jgi:hypothetical protein
VQWLDVNLATSPARNTTLVYSFYSVAALVLAAATWANVSTYREQHARGRELAGQVGSFAKQQRDLETRAGRARAAIQNFDVTALHLQASKANQIIDWKAFSWTKLFNMMERIQPGGVRMNGVRPVFYGGGDSGDPRASGADGWGVPVSVEGTARSLGEIGEFEQRLQDDPHFAFVLPEHLSRSDSGEIVFQLRFHYRPDLPPAPAAAEAKPSREPAQPTAVEVEDEWGDVSKRKQGSTP